MLLQLIPDCPKTPPSYVRNSLVGLGLAATIEQFFDTVTTDWRNDPELGKMARIALQWRSCGNANDVTSATAAADSLSVRFA